MERELAGLEWNAPGVARLALLLTTSMSGQNPIPIDTWINSYAPLANYTMTLASGFNNIVPPIDWLVARWFVFVPPRSNAQTIVLKGVTGDTGLNLNPNGPIVLPIPPLFEGGIGLTAGASIPGCRVMIF